MAETRDTLPPVAVDENICDRDGCGEPAVFAYQFDWGEAGKCCAKHATLLQQVANQIGRTVALHPLLPATNAPLTRDEKTQLVAKHLVLEQELEEVKARGLDLYRVNGDQARTIATLTLRDREAKAQLKDAAAQLVQLQGKLEEREAEHAELVAEIERLRSLEVMVTGVGRADSEPRTTVD